MKKFLLFLFATVLCMPGAVYSRHACVPVGMAFTAVGEAPDDVPGANKSTSRELEISGYRPVGTVEKENAATSKSDAGQQRVDTLRERRDPRLWPGSAAIQQRRRDAVSDDRAWRYDEKDTIARIRDISYKSAVNVSLLLPLSDNGGRVDARFVDFYYGVLLGLEDLKVRGISSNVSLYNTGRSESAVSEIILSDDFRNTDLIIGPVYAGLDRVVEFAEENGVPVVSPLGIQEHTSSPMLYQMPPWPDSAKYGKLLEMVSSPDVNVIYVNTSDPDRDMEKNLRPYLPYGMGTVYFSIGMQARELSGMIDRSKRENIFIVSCESDGVVVDNLLGMLSSIQNNLVARTGTSPNIRVVGNAAWRRFNSDEVEVVDRELYFKLRLCFVTTYHADRSDERVRHFDSRYIDSFGSFPSLFSYRGYDAAKLFAGAAMTAGDDFTQKVNSCLLPLLQVPYRMVQYRPGSDFRNMEWVMVCYERDYNIYVR